MKKLLEQGEYSIIAYHDGMTFLLSKRPDISLMGFYIDHRGNPQEVWRKSVYGMIAEKLLEMSV